MYLRFQDRGHKLVHVDIFPVKFNKANLTKKHDLKKKISLLWFKGFMDERKLSIYVTGTKEVTMNI